MLFPPGFKPVLSKKCPKCNELSLISNGEYTFCISNNGEKCNYSDRPVQLYEMGTPIKDLVFTITTKQETKENLERSIKKEKIEEFGNYITEKRKNVC